MRRYLLALFACTLAILQAARALAESAPEGIRVLTDLSYKLEGSLTDYQRTRCKLDLYLPPTGSNFATLVWFHGGGLQKGDKAGTKEDTAKTPRIARSLAAGGIAVVAPNYRLSPQVKFPAYVEDAAAAVAWTRARIAQHGGDPRRVFVGGHSAGGYLALMLAMDERFLAASGMKTSDVAGFIPMSGQTMTHYTIREERGQAKLAITADEAAPVHYIRKDTPPMLALYADRDMAARAEENMFFVAMMQGAGNKGVIGKLITDRTHGSIASEMENASDPARLAILEFIRANRTK